MEQHKLDVVVAGHYSPECMEVAFSKGHVQGVSTVRSVGYPVNFTPGHQDTYVDFSRGGVISTLSTRRPSISNTSKVCPSHSNRSPAAGTRPKLSITKPPTV